MKELVDRARSEGKTAIVYFDPDVDGLFAGLFWVRFLMAEGIRFDTYINPERKHGYFGGDWSDRLIVNGDFTITPAQMKELEGEGNIVINLDHHEVPETKQYESSRGVIINNQFPFEDEEFRYQSGAGVVWEVLSALRPDIFLNQTDAALVGITLLSDVRDISGDHARVFLEAAFTHPYEGYIKYLIDETRGDRDFAFGEPRLDRNYIDFKFSPKINSLLRFDGEKEAVKFILGGGYPKDRDYQTEQRELVKSALEASGVAQKIEYPAVTFLALEGFRWGNFVGLIASRLLDEGKPVICFSHTKGRVLRASFRGGKDLPYREELVKEGVLDGRGHSGAFGIIGFTPNKETLREVNRVVEGLEASGKERGVKVVTVQNLGTFLNRPRGMKVARENEYLMSADQIFINWVGAKSRLKKTRGSSRFQEWSVDGVKVLSFDLTKDPTNALIGASLSRGRAEYILGALKDSVELVEVE